MLSNVINAGKDIANKLTNKFLNLSEVEAKIKTATNDDNWGPNGSLMKEISDETFSTSNFHEVMTFLWYRIFTEKPQNSRRIYKGLVLLSYLIINGSDLVAVSCKAHLYDIMKLKSYVDSHGVADSSIRRKASDICELLNDSQRLSDERKRAKNYQTRYYRSESVTGVSTFDSKHTNAQSLGDIDDWEPGSKSIPYVIGETFVNFVNTFTQNISGPPPTETHDNFDIPPTSYEITTPTEEDLVYKSLPKVHKSDSLENNEKIYCKSKEKNVTEHIEVMPEKPIIDFSEPITDNFKNNNANSLFTIPDNIVDNDIDAEFGNLRNWNNLDSLTHVNNNNYNNNNTSQMNMRNYFTPDFDSFTQSNNNNNEKATNLIQLSASQSDPNAKLPSTLSKSEKKIGSTWNDIDALNIDLNNLCGRKHLYSKS